MFSVYEGPSATAVRQLSEWARIPMSRLRSLAGGLSRAGQSADVSAITRDAIDQSSAERIRSREVRRLEPVRHGVRRLESGGDYRGRRARPGGGLDARRRGHGLTALA